MKRKTLNSKETEETSNNLKKQEEQEEREEQAKLNEQKKIESTEKNKNKDKEYLKQLQKFKSIKLNKIHFIIGLISIILIFLSYHFVGEVDATNKNLEENSIINIFGYEIDLKSTSLLLAAIIIGLLDGFNPCAMWVLIYLISLASTLKDKKKMFVIVGTFVATEAIMYFIVLAGWLSLFSFVGYSQIVITIVGVFALITGVLGVNDFIKKGGQITCEVGDMESKKNTVMKIDSIINSPITITSIFATIILAIVINSIEFVCSAGLPAIFTQMLAISDISILMKYFYIFVYDVFFMIDDFIIFGLAFWALNSDWMAKYSGMSKLIGGIIMTIIGIILLFFPQLLL